MKNKLLQRTIFFYRRELNRYFCGRFSRGFSVVRFRKILFFSYVWGIYRKNQLFLHHRVHINKLDINTQLSDPKKPKSHGR
jgi:hypothetical protein